MKNKILTSFMAGAMIMTSAMPVMATELTSGVTESQSILEKDAIDGTTRPTDVLYEQGSTFSVTIPKTIILDGATKASDYTINVKGDISSDKQVKVSPDATFDMVDQANVTNKKANVVASVTQEETIWTSVEVCQLDETATSIGTNKDGNISATGLTSGAWKGTFNFSIAMEDVVSE